MFTGIIQCIAPVTHLFPKENILSYAIKLPIWLQENLKIGASIAIDGTCQTITAIEGDHVWFDAIGETLQKTTLKFLKKGQEVNVERAARFGDEIGGHLLSGHIVDTISIKKILQPENQYIVVCHCPEHWLRYIFPKGYVALNGASLTVVDVNSNSFSVHLIPETIAKTTFKFKKEGDPLNLEIDSQTQTIVDTLTRLQSQRPNLH